jgi:c-di-GMP-binding flagellar brake protein YcgR
MTSNEPDETAELRRRRHKRYGHNGTITLCRIPTGPVVLGDLFDLSAGGCLVWTETAVRFNPSDIIEVKLQAGYLVFRVMGSVRYTSEAGRLLGVEFQHLGLKESVALDHFIHELEAAADLENSLLCH